MTDTPVLERVPMSAPDLDESDMESVVAVLRSGRLALGPQAEAFERAVADYVGAAHAVAVSSGTAALHLLVRALGLGPGDEVLVPSFTFAATVNALLYEGVRPVFVDIERDTYNLDPDDLVRRRTPRTRGVMVVDVFGHPAEWQAITEFAERHQLAVIDDACEALGAAYGGKKIGRFGDAATFAFYPNKQLTTGEGGMIVTDRDDIAALARSLRNQGRGEMGQWLEHERLGYNYRMDELSAALGVSQCRRLEQFVAARQRVADLYTERLQHVAGVRPPVVRPGVTVSWFVYVVTLQPGIARERVMQLLTREGIPSRGYFSALHLQPYMRERCGTGPGLLPVTEDVAQRTLALPFHNRMTAADVDLVVGALELAVQRAA